MPRVLAPADALAALTGATDPWLFGVRHHSSACAAALPPLLDRLAPDVILVELPADVQPWLPWVGHAEVVPPIALAAVAGGSVAFYPLAAFSPELQAIRWAVARGVPVEAFDLPIGAGIDDGPEDDGASNGLLDALLVSNGAPDAESLWDRLVEAPAAGADPEAVRGAALLYGWALRADGPARPRDLARERHMRARIAAARGRYARIAAVIGSYHAAALIDADADPRPRLPGATAPVAGAVVTSLQPYTAEQLDSRSGYPAGIRDPAWHARAHAALAAGEPVDGVAGEVLVEVCRHIRAARHPAGTPDAAEALRLARGLAALRGLASPGRREVLEAVESAMTHGEVLGRGRVVARALERVLVGADRGRLAPGTPRSGLAPHVEALVEALRLPGPGEVPTEPLRLDPLRSELDRRRHVTLHRLAAAGVIYADRTGNEDDEALTAAWAPRWTAATEATLAAASLRGPTLPQAATGALRARAAELAANDQLDPAARVAWVAEAAACGLPDLVVDGLADLRGPVVAEAGLVELVAALELVERIAHGHVPGSPVDPDRVVRDEPGAVPNATIAGQALADARDELLAAAVRALDGLQGSTDLADVRALTALTRVFEGAPERLGDGRLAWALERLADEGSAPIQGGAGACRVMLGVEPAAALGERLASWLDAGDVLAGRLQGVLTAMGPQLEGHPELLLPLARRISALDDQAFLARLPALRDGFDVLSPAARDRLLGAVSEHLDGEPIRAELDVDPAALAALAAADRAGEAAVLALGLPWPAPPPPAPVVPDAPIPDDPANTLRARDRWRLLLGRRRRDLPPQTGRYARALDELYGRGRGEGSNRAGGAGGGDEPPFPTVRDWGEELGALFGGHVRQEVLGRAAERGDANAALALDPDSVRPSVELLEQVLSLKGGLSEAQLDTLRRLVDRVVAALVHELAVRIRPALTGLTLPRPSRRRTDRLDLRRTVLANLRHARPRADGPAELVTERLVFRTRGRRAVDWRVMLVVDTSGSMDANIVHAAMMAAILSGLPAVHVDFLAFNTAVIDLSERVDDPLALLLEVQIGGGTDIGRALRFARGRITSPTRTLCIVVSDFEEGGPVGRLVAEARALVESGVKMLGLAALNEQAQPCYNVAISEALVAAGMPIAALTPLELARWVGEQIR